MHHLALVGNPAPSAMETWRQAHSFLLSKDYWKFWFARHGLESAWRVLRDIVLNPWFYLRLLLTFCIFERFFAVSRRKQWITPNIRLDFMYPVLNALVFGAISAAFVTGIKVFYDAHLPFLNTGLLDRKPIVVQALGAFLITDFMFFLSHYIRHKVTWFWYFHAIHHSQTDLNPLTTHRGHPLETVISNAIRTIPIAFVGGSYPVWLWFTIFNDLWGYVIHSNSRINLGPFKKIIVSPQYHRVHHSRDRRHYDKNFGERLVIWDTIFGTRYDHYDEYPSTGVDELPDETHAKGARALLWQWCYQVMFPFRMIYRSIATAVKRRLDARTA